MKKLPLKKGGECFEVMGKKVSYIVSAFEYSKSVRNAIHKFKFSDKPYYADTFTYFMNRVLEEVLRVEGFDIIIPVPIGKKRLKKRGYNQAALLADGLKCGETKVDEAALIKFKDNEPQSIKNAHDRFTNVKGCFKCTKNLSGASVLLVDDVCTTGATINSCADELLKNGARKVCAITVAKTNFKTIRPSSLYFFKK